MRAKYYDFCDCLLFDCCFLFFDAHTDLQRVLREETLSDDEEDDFRLVVGRHSSLSNSKRQRNVTKKANDMADDASGNKNKNKEANNNNNNDTDGDVDDDDDDDDEYDDDEEDVREKKKARQQRAKLIDDKLDDEDDDGNATSDEEVDEPLAKGELDRLHKREKVRKKLIACLHS